MSETRVIREKTKLDPEHPDFLPSIVVQDGKVYVGGIHVWKEQLSMKELAEYFPDEYQDVYKGEIICPLCKKIFNTADGRHLRAHCRLAHKPWYEEFGSLFDEFNDGRIKKEGFKPLLAKVRSTMSKEEVKV